MPSIATATIVAVITITVPIASAFVVAAAVVVVPVFAITITSPGMITPLVVLTGLVIVDRTIASMLEAVFANIVIGYRTVGIRLVIIDRAVATQLHAICIQVVRQRDRSWRRSRLRKRAERGASPYDRTKSHTESQLFHKEGPDPDCQPTD